MDHFHARGCRLSDHGLQKSPLAPAGEAEIERILRDRLSGRIPEPGDAEKYLTALLLAMGAGIRAPRLDNAAALFVPPQRERAHVPAARPGLRLRLHRRRAGRAAASMLLNALEDENALPKTILYSLNLKTMTCSTRSSAAFRGRRVSLQGAARLGLVVQRPPSPAWKSSLCPHSTCRAQYVDLTLQQYRNQKT